MSSQDNVIIAGAGPVGLSTALCLADRGVPVTAFETLPALHTELRAGTLHPPTLDMLAPYGVTDKMLQQGIVVRKWQLRDRREGLLAEFDLGLIKDDTAFPYRLHLEQHKLTPILLEAVEGMAGFEIQFSSTVTAATQDADGVSVTIEGAEGPRTVRGAYLIGAEGAHSVVRKAMGVEFEGYTWPEASVTQGMTFDFEPYGYAYSNYISDPEDSVVLFKVPGFNPPAIWRLAFKTDPDGPAEEILSDEAIQARLQGFLPRDEPYDIVHRGIFRVHQRVAASYETGRMLLVGDAAHLNNPMGSMGLNGGIHDGVNLADKLARLWHGEAGPEILELYDRQRRPPQIEFVQAMSVRNLEAAREKDPEARRKRHEDVRRMADDPQKARQYMLNTSMIAMVRMAAAIT